MNFYTTHNRLGILGGGQLGKMLINEANKLNIGCKVMDSNSDAPCSKLVEGFVIGDLLSYDDVYNFGKTVDVLTIEIENVNTDALERLEKEGVKVYPSSLNIKTIQNKSTQKNFYLKNKLPSSYFKTYKNINDLISDANAEKCKYPFVWKSARFGYDGKGVKVIFDIKDLKGLPDIECIIEDKVSIKKELSIIIARNNNSQEINFPTVEMEFNDANLVDKVICPAQISDEINKKAIEIALKTSRAFNHIGLLAVELFLTEGDEILINEVAPRPHNSGHHTIECCMTSQFEQHLRAVLNLDLGSTSIKIPGVMLNLVGEENHTGEVIYEKIEDVLKTEGASIHIYGKKQTKPNRKMGHITIVNKELNNAKKLAEKIRKSIKVISK
ncbi:5-(carboxyamino)imidazole ribonucleotide synthase [Flavobacteriaceae bacterium]|nr:5-(carboxyamino)imidazole ribonucleotide synthase [Flavobacteriaceae bacterium]MDB4180231.1 5-(carboxyamino)imidazole ribonucleotide synthase [Flavobacteriaceae bacterium]